MAWSNLGLYPRKVNTFPVFHCVSASINNIDKLQDNLGIFMNVDFLILKVNPSIFYSNSCLFVRLPLNTTQLIVSYLKMFVISPHFVRMQSCESVIRLRLFSYF